MENPHQLNSELSAQDRAMALIVIPAIIIIIASAITAAMIMNKKKPEQEENKAPKLIVEVTKVRKQDVNYIISSHGMVKSKTNTSLVSEVNGNISKIAEAFIPGAFIKKGDILVSIDDSDYQTELKTAEANLARANANLAEEKARSQQAEREWRRMNNKGKANDLVLRKPQLAREQANVLSAEAELARAQRNLERTIIRAPYDGLIRERLVDIGQFISRGTQLGQVSATDIAEVRLPLLDKDLAYLTTPQNVSGKVDKSEMPLVNLSAESKGLMHQWQGEICRTEGIIDEKTRVIYAVAQVKDPYKLNNTSVNAKPLMFGTFVSADIVGDHSKDMVILPRHSLLANDKVIVVNNENRIEIRKVTVQRTDTQYVYISDGLQDGELISLTPIENPINGMLVEVGNPEHLESAGLKG